MPLSSKCPHCAKELALTKIEGGVVYLCPQCGGLLVGLGLLKRKMDPKLVQSVWMKAQSQGRAGNCVCPTCPHPMKVIEVPIGNSQFDVDVCSNCYHIWFDKAELEKLPANPRSGEAESAPRQPYSGIPLDITPRSYGSDFDFDTDEVDLALDLLGAFIENW